MPCFRPYKIWKDEKGAPQWSPHRNHGMLTLPCGQCIGCRMDRSQDWATRMAHEAQMHEHNCFLTLTYRDEDRPADRSVCVRTVQLFMKRYRKWATVPLRFFACGEYGGQNQREHYHLLIFGHDFQDKTLWRQSPSGHPLYRSASLEKLWPFGHSEIGEVTHSSARYVAGYVLKKITGEAAAEHYRRVNPETGEVWEVSPEFVTMSRKPGLGGPWFDEFRCDAFPSDFVVIDGKKKPIPRFYLNQLKKLADENPDGEGDHQFIHDLVTTKRKRRTVDRSKDQTDSRLKVREYCQEKRNQRLIRQYEASS